jgi:hypothetical protein
MLGGFALCDMLHENWKRLLSDFIHHRENEVDEKGGKNVRGVRKSP